MKADEAERPVKRELGPDLGTPVVEPPEKKEKTKDFYIGTPTEPEGKKLKTVANLEKEWTMDEEPFWDDAWIEEEFGEDLTDEMQEGPGEGVESHGRF